MLRELVWNRALGHHHHMTQLVETLSAVHVVMEVSKGDPVVTAETGNGGTMVTTIVSTTVIIIIGNGHTAVAMGMTMDQVRIQLIRPKG